MLTASAKEFFQCVIHCSFRVISNTFDVLEELGVPRRGNTGSVICSVS